MKSRKRKKKVFSLWPVKLFNFIYRSCSFPITETHWLCWGAGSGQAQGAPDASLVSNCLPVSKQCCLPPTSGLWFSDRSWELRGQWGSRAAPPWPHVYMTPKGPIHRLSPWSYFQSCKASRAVIIHICMELQEQLTSAPNAPSIIPITSQLLCLSW